MKFVRLFSCVLLLCAIPDLGVADLIDHGSVVGDTVFFGDIQEISNTYDGAVYGAPAGSGDTLSFTPFGFSGFTDGGVDFHEGRMSVNINANEGYLIQAIEIAEASSFFFFGEDSMVMSNTLGVASANGEIFSNSSSSEMHGDAFTGGNDFETIFSVELPDVESATFVLDSQVFAAALGEFDVASISKDALVVRVITVPTAGIPEPGMAGLFAIGALALVMARRVRD